MQIKVQVCHPLKASLVPLSTEHFTMVEGREMGWWEQTGSRSSLVSKWLLKLFCSILNQYMPMKQNVKIEESLSLSHKR